MHSHCRELCTLAATGQIEPEERVAVEQHLRSCRKCRAFLDDIALVGSRGMPLAAAKRVEHALVAPPGGIRERFLQRAVAEGFHTNPGPVLARPLTGWEIDSSERAEVPESLSPSKSWLTMPPLAPFHAALAIAFCLIFGIFGYLLALGRHSMKPVTPTKTATNFTVSVSLPASTYQQADKERTELETRLQTISSQLSTAQAEKRELAQKLADVAQQMAKGTQYEQRFKQQARSLQDAEDRVSKLEADLEAAQRRLSEDEAILVAQQEATQDATAKLANTEFQLQREREVYSARNEISQLISARNLHIIDVRDTEPGGKRQRAFGRVFYVEGQSLVFYAYDLAASSHPNRQFTFHVWGETASVKETTYSLGILHSDDTSQARWVLTFDDPKVLNRINAVYITADHETPSKTPQGRKLLYAFLGAPNHP